MKKYTQKGNLLCNVNKAAYPCRYNSFNICFSFHKITKKIISRRDFFSTLSYFKIVFFSILNVHEYVLCNFITGRVLWSYEFLNRAHTLQHNFVSYFYFYVPNTCRVTFGHLFCNFGTESAIPMFYRQTDNRFKNDRSYYEDAHIF